MPVSLQNNAKFMKQFLLNIMEEGNPRRTVRKTSIYQVSYH
jgi:hypothetical protein